MQLRNRNKLPPDGPLGTNADLTYLPATYNNLPKATCVLLLRALRDERNYYDIIQKP